MISVIIPVYNTERYLSKCIDSVIAQTYKDWEIILVDDGSTDKSGDIADLYAHNNSKIRVFHQENCGVSAARNKGLEEAKGTHILFVDSDDWLDHRMFDEMCPYLNDYDMVLCGNYNIRVLENGQIEKKEINPWSPKQSLVEIDDVYYEILCKTATLWNKVISKAAIKDNKFAQSISYGEDALFLASIARNINKAIAIPKPLYYYYHNRPGNVVSSHIDMRSVNLLKSALEIYKITKANGEPVCGVWRVHRSINEIYWKIPTGKEKDYIAILALFRKTIHQISYIDRLMYFMDRRFSIKSRLQFALIAISPYAMARYSSYKRSR